MTDQIEPVRVEVTNLGGLERGAKRKRIKAVYRTFVLTAANPVIPILAEDLSRRTTYVQAITNSVLLCESQSQAQEPANSVAAAFANPSGTLLFVPATGAAVSTRWPLDTNDVMWATAIAFPAMLTMTIHNEAEGY
jgi:hypothetical protein